MKVYSWRSETISRYNVETVLVWFFVDNRVEATSSLLGTGDEATNRELAEQRAKDMKSKYFREKARLEPRVLDYGKINKLGG